MIGMTDMMIENTMDTKTEDGVKVTGTIIGTQGAGDDSIVEVAMIEEDTIIAIEDEGTLQNADMYIVLKRRKNRHQICFSVMRSQVGI